MYNRYEFIFRIKSILSNTSVRLPSKKFCKNLQETNIFDQFHLASDTLS